MAKVRGNGTIVQLEKDKPKARCRKWHLFVNTGRNLATGKYGKVSRRFSGTYSEAQAALRALIAEIDEGKTAPNDMTFERYADAWLERRERTVAAGTFRKNQDHVKCLKMQFAHAKLKDITTEAVEQAYSALMEGKSPSGRRLSGTYTAGVATTLYMMLSQAQDEGYVATNAAAKAKRPKIDTPPKKALSAEQIHELVESLDVTQPSAFVVAMCIKTGMRRGEVHGLSVGDIEGDVLHVRHSFDDSGNLKEPKTKNSVRDIPLAPSVAKTISERVEQIKSDFAAANERLGLTLSVNANTPLVCNEIGERQTPHATTAWWRKHRAALGLDGWTVHEMRHSYLSELARRKVEPKVLQQLAGHAKFSTTMDIYVHVDMEQKQQAVALMDW
jgi:integrase